MAVITETKKTEKRTVRDLLLASAAAFSDKPALLAKTADGYETYTYRRLWQDTKALAATLDAKGLVGKRMLILGENGYVWALGFLAALTVGVVAVPVNKTADAEALAAIYEYTRPDAVFFADALSSSVAPLPEAAERLPFSSLDTLLAEGRALLDSGAADLTAPLDETAPAALLLVSASGEPPRAAALSNENLTFAAARVPSMLGLGKADRFLSILPLHHSYSLVFDLLTPLSVGASVAFSEGLHAIIKNMGETQPTVLTASPLIAEALARKAQKILSGYGKIHSTSSAAMSLLPTPLSAPLKKQLFRKLHLAFGGSLRTVICSGAPVGAHDLKPLSDVGIVMLECYGLCESTSAVALNPRRAPRHGSAGKPLPDCLVDVYNKGEDGIGEIRVKSGGVMLGYFEDEEATAKALSGGWLYTGDLGYLDEKGYLHVVGRKKNLMVSRTGRSIFPEELEALLHKEPFVRETVVVGFANEQRHDYDLVAVVYPDVERLFEVYGENYTIRDAEREIAAALDRVNATLPEHKRIDHFVLRGTEFAKTSARKIRRTGVASSIEDEYRKKLQK